MNFQKLLFFLICLIFYSNSNASYIVKFPHKITQPDGKSYTCYITGDEYYSWLHDNDNYTIVQDEITGYFCYATLSNNKLIASKCVVGKDSPILYGIKPNLKIPEEDIAKLYSDLKMNREYEEQNVYTKSAQAVRNINNIVIYISFADQPEFGAKQATYSSYFNASASGANSMYNYFREVSYQNLNVTSTFYPLNNGTQIISYKDNHIRNYYCPYSAQNDSGYSLTDTGVMMKARERTLVTNAIDSVKSQIPSNLELDTEPTPNNKVDNICFIIRGAPVTPVQSFAKILWPHAYEYSPPYIYINNKAVYSYNFQIEDYLDNPINGQTGVLCHEMFHSLGAGDLYHGTNNGITPVGTWDLMATQTNPPQSMCADYKYRYGRWISEIPPISVSGHYSLNPITSPINNCYKISSSNTEEYFVLEFRQKTGTFESSIPGTGLIIYRINKSACCWNLDGPPDWIYIYRPDGTLTNNGTIANANFDSSLGRFAFHNATNPSCFLSNGSLGNVYIKNITVSGNTVSFDVRFCDGDIVTHSNTSQLPSFSNAITRIETSGTVVVKSTDNVTLEAGQEIILNPGFEIQLGGQLTTNMNSCGNQ